MKIALFLTLTCATLFGVTLLELIESAKTDNNDIRAANITTLSKQKELDASKKGYYPTLDGTLFYNRDDEPNPFRAAITYGARATLGIDIYDGGDTYHDIRQKEEELHASRYDFYERKNATALAIAKRFFNLKSLLQQLIKIIGK